MDEFIRRLKALIKFLNNLDETRGVVKNNRLLFRSLDEELGTMDPYVEVNKNIAQV